MLALSACAGGDGRADERSGATATTSTPPAPAMARWTLVLSDLTLGAGGIGFGLHPTSAPIVVQAEAAAALEVCPAEANGRPAGGRGTSFGTLWRSGCRPLGEAPVALPATRGRSHVGFRVRPRTGAPAAVTALRIRWACADAHLVVEPGDATPPPPALTPDCGDHLAR